MTATRKKPAVATVCVLNANTTKFDGPGVQAAFAALGVTYQRSRFDGGWLCPGRHTAEVLDLLASRGYRVEAIL